MSPETHRQITQQTDHTNREEQAKQAPDEKEQEKKLTKGNQVVSALY